jgi:hypothetical protein
MVIRTKTENKPKKDSLNKKRLTVVKKRKPEEPSKVKKGKASAVNKTVVPEIRVSDKKKTVAPDTRKTGAEVKKKAVALDTEKAGLAVKKKSRAPVPEKKSVASDLKKSRSLKSEKKGSVKPVEAAAPGSQKTRAGRPGKAEMKPPVIPGRPVKVSAREAKKPVKAVKTPEPAAVRRKPSEVARSGKAVTSKRVQTVKPAVKNRETQILPERPARLKPRIRPDGKNLSRKTARLPAAEAKVAKPGNISKMKSGAGKNGEGLAAGLMAGDKPALKPVLIEEKPASEKQPVLEKPVEVKPVRTRVMPDRWSECGQIYFTAGKAYAVTSNLRTLCIGEEADVHQYLLAGKARDDWSALQKEVLQSIKQFRQEEAGHSVEARAAEAALPPARSKPVRPVRRLAGARKRR